VSHTCPVNRSGLLLIVLLAGLAASGCGKKIGDACRTNIDCQQNGTRICDLSQPGGYCTEDGCDENSCPSGSICVRFFDQAFATVPCSDEEPCPSANDVCVTRRAGDTVPGKVCAPAASERRYCADTCGGDGDCRGAYSCQAAGTYGSLALLKDPADLPDAKFCSPTPP
jgi:hypothetical protein